MGEIDQGRGQAFHRPLRVGRSAAVAFEVWNEPNLPGFWKNADMAEYFKLYKVTAHAIKEVDSGLKVGGPAICGGADHWLTAFLDFCHRRAGASGLCHQARLYLFPAG